MVALTPPKLSDNVNPCFEDWEKGIIGKFRVNSDHFPNEESNMTM
jgi:hypothetical protein